MNRRKTEGDLEARLHRVLKEAFPWLTGDALQHQTHFSINFGRATIEVKGNSRDQAQGRSDILVRAQGKPLAIVELKREGTPLDDTDAAQAISYARLTTPMTPFAIVSNGTHQRIHITYSGEVWQPTERTEQELFRRLESVGQLADASLDDAVNTLMGSDRQWIPALRAVTKTLIESRTGSWDEPLAPFVRDFLLPRQATALLADALSHGERAILVHGAPLSGKSNILRELAEGSREENDSAVLLLEPSDVGVFGAVANVLASELGWNVSADEAREWLRRISNGTSSLILAIDGIELSYTRVLGDLNELASNRFGNALRLVATVDDTALERITKKPNGREANALGRIAKDIGVHPLGDTEFEHARKVLAQNHIDLTQGGESVLALREPWILRSLIAKDRMSLPDSAGKVVRIPPLLDIVSLDRAAGAFPRDEETESLLRNMAGAIVDQYLAPKSVAAQLQRISTFAIDARELSEAIERSGIEHLSARGYIKAGIDVAAKPVWLIRAPAVVAAHVAIALADRIDTWADPEKTAQHLIALASRLPLGDVIVAKALVLRVKQHKSRNFLDIVSALLGRSPTLSALSPGQRLVFAIHGHVVHATVTDTGKLALHTNSSKIEIDLEREDLGEALTDVGGWLILSQLAAVPLALDIPGEIEPARLDEPLLLEIGQAKVVLSQHDGAHGFKDVVIHDVPGHGSIVCHKAGIVEPITWALVQYFLNRGPDATGWLDDAIAKESLPLLTRIHIALRFVAGAANSCGPWAKSILAERLEPVLAQFPIHH